MAENKTKPTQVNVDTYLLTVSEKRRDEAYQLMKLMEQISGEQATMWGPSIIGFGSTHYRYESGREGDMPRLGFSPRKSAITIYFSEGFGRYGALLKKLGTYKNSVSCLYISQLNGIDLGVLRQMLQESYQVGNEPMAKPTTIDEYIARVPTAAQPQFNVLRKLVQELLPQAEEVISYGIIGYKTDDKRPRVFISGWKDHVSIYPVPKDAALQAELKPYIRGKGTLWFALDTPLPAALIKKTIAVLVR